MYIKKHRYSSEWVGHRRIFCGTGIKTSRKFGNVQKNIGA